MTTDTIDALLASIAKEHLGLSTLETRNSDDLDFHDLPTWSVEAALAAAYRAGAASMKGNDRYLRFGTPPRKVAK